MAHGRTEPEMSEWLASLRNIISLTRLELGPLSAQDTLQIAHELADTGGVQSSLPVEHACFQPSPRHIQAPGSSSSHAPKRSWLFAETNGQPFYLFALLQELLERGILVPRLIEGSSWVFEPQPSILEATPPDSLLPSDVRAAS
jgi:hypothetical protein